MSLLDRATSHHLQILSFIFVIFSVTMFPCSLVYSVLKLNICLKIHCSRGLLSLKIIHLCHMRLFTMVSATNCSHSSPQPEPSAGIDHYTRSLSLRTRPSSPTSFHVIPCVPLSLDSSTRTSFRASGGSMIFFETQIPDVVSQHRPLSYPYRSPIEDMHTVHQNQVSMPNHNDFIPVAITRRNTTRLPSAQPSEFRSPPYPFHDVDSDGVYLCQPKAEDFLGSKYPFSPSPVIVYDSDPDLPVTEPDSYLQTGSTEQHSKDADIFQPNNLHTDALAYCSTEFESHECSEPNPVSSLDVPSQLPEPIVPDHHGRVQSIDSDMYQPTLGGLHKISNIQRKDSKRDKVKRAIRSLNPFRCQWQLGHASRR
jgi:hypothetical protein